MSLDTGIMKMHTRLVSLGFIAMACAAISMSANADVAVTTWADDVVSVDSSGFRTAVGTATLRCSPKWLSSEAGAPHSLSAVTNATTP